MNMKPQGLLHTLPIPQKPWDSIAMDFVGPFPISKQCDYLLVVICRLTSMVHLLPTTTTASSSDVANLYYREIVRLHGLPTSIVSDRDSKFTATFWRELHRLMGTRLLMSTAYHPQTDGSTERANRTVAQILRTLITSDQTDWIDHVPMTEFAINSAVSSTTGFAPFDLNYGSTPSLLQLPRDHVPTEFPGVTQFAERARLNVCAAHDAILVSRVAQTFHANKKRRPDVVYQIGELAYLSTENLRLPAGRARKLLPRFVGPYEIIGANPDKSVYELKLPAELTRRRIFPKFHASRLRPHVPNDDAIFPGREALAYYDFGQDPESEWVVRDIESHRWTPAAGHEFYVRWEFGDASWEDMPTCRDLAALDRYLDLMGVAEISQLSAEGPAISEEPLLLPALSD